MSGKSKWDYLKAIYGRYRKASRAVRSRILDEFCQVCGYNRKYAIRLLNQTLESQQTIQRRRLPRYGSEVQQALLPLP